MKNRTAHDLVLVCILVFILCGLCYIAEDYSSRSICEEDIGKPMAECVFHYWQDVTND